MGKRKRASGRFEWWIERNVGEAIARLHPCAVDISSGVEISKGVKDPALIQQFVDAVRVADSNDHS